MKKPLKQFLGVRFNLSNLDIAAHGPLQNAGKTCPNGNCCSETAYFDHLIDKLGDIFPNRQTNCSGTTVIADFRFNNVFSN